jgi:hypothetical protein
VSLTEVRTLTLAGKLSPAKDIIVHLQPKNKTISSVLQEKVCYPLFHQDVLGFCPELVLWRHLSPTLKRFGRSLVRFAHSLCDQTFLRKVGAFCRKIGKKKQLLSKNMTVNNL